MPTAEVAVGVAALLEQCAQRSAGVVAPAYGDEPPQVARMLQAEAAGRELMAALVRADPFPDLSLGASLRRLVGYLQTVISASTPHDQLVPLLTVCVHQVALSLDAARRLRDGALLLILAALDDEAQAVAVRLDRTERGTVLTVESDRPGLTAELPALHALRSAVLGGGGAWETSQATHGGSWLVILSLPIDHHDAKEAQCGE
jgi:hypothetical protein